MVDKESSLPWGYMLASASLGVVGTVAAGLLLPIFTDRKPDLVYDVSPPANFSSTAVQLSIFDTLVENVGNREAEEVKVHLSVSGTRIQELVVRPSLKSIDFAELVPPSAAERVLQVPRLNQGESIKFSLLVNDALAKDLSVEVRGAGVNGRQRSDDGQGDILKWMRLVAAAIATAAFVMTLLSVFKGWSDRRLLEAMNTNLRVSRNQMRLATAALETASGSLEKVVVGPIYRLVFNPKTRASKVIRFGPGGVILEGANQNESLWRIRDGFLELIDVERRVHSRFVYNILEQKFEQLLDEEQGSYRKHNILGQYIVRELE